MTSIETIEDLATLEAAIAERLASLHAEAIRVQSQWAGLGRVGGQREDHAAALLSTLLPSLCELERFTGAAGRQVSAMQADPFGRKSA